MGKYNVSQVVVRSDPHLKDTTPQDQLPQESRAVRRGSGGERPIGMGVTVHVIKMWMRAPHPRYGDRLPHFTPVYLPCVADHRQTKTCYARRPRART